MQYGQTGKKINKQEYYCTRCKRKLPYKICPLHGMESVIMLEGDPSSGFGVPNSNNGMSGGMGAGKKPRPLPSGTGFENTAPPARPAAPQQSQAPMPVRPQTQPVVPANGRPAQPAPARPAPPPVRPAAPPAPQATRPPVAPPAPRIQRPPVAPPSRNPQVSTAPRVTPPPPMPTPVAQQHPQPARPVPPQQPRQQAVVQPRMKKTDDGTIFFETEEVGDTVFYGDENQSSSLEDLIEQNLNSIKSTRSPLEEATKESTNMDMGYQNEPISFNTPNVPFQEEELDVFDTPQPTDPGIYRQPESREMPKPATAPPTPRSRPTAPPVRQNNTRTSDAPTNGKIKRPKRRRANNRARQTGLPVYAKLALFTMIPTILIAAAVFFSYDKISTLGAALLGRISQNPLAQQSNLPPVNSDDSLAIQPETGEPEEGSSTGETAVYQGSNPGNSQESLETLMSRAEVAYEKKQFLQPKEDNAVSYIQSILQKQEDFQPAIELKSKIIEYYNDRATIALQSSKYDLAISNYESILEITPDDPLTSRLLTQAKELRRSSRILRSIEDLNNTQDEVKRLQKEKYKLKTQVKEERRKLEQISQDNE